MQVSSKFKYTIDLGVSATKSTLKLKKSNKDKVTHILLIVFVFLMSGLLVWDILKGNSFVIDIIILVALVGVEIFSLVMPSIIIHTQKKFLNQLDLDNMDYTETVINKDKCTETYYKDNKIVMQNVCDMSKLMSYEVKQEYMFVVFSNFACAIFKIETLSVELSEFVDLLNAKISKNKLANYR